MAVVKLYNLACMTTSTVGTGTITLGAAATVNSVLYLSFAAAGVANAEVVMYSVLDTNASEVGYGTYTSAGTTLTRNVITSTNSNAAISLSGGAIVRILPLAGNFMLGAIVPQGRLTLASATPVMTTTQSAKTTIYYTSYAGNLVPIYNGAFFVNTPFTELSNVTSNSSTGSAGPAAVANNSNYDLFVWSNSGTVTLTRGPLWTSDTGRGTGAGTSELVMVNGIWTNTVAITNGPGASLGTYVGTVRSNGSAQIDYIFGAVAAGGTAGVIGVWNTYNRVRVATMVGDNTNSWTYATATTWRAPNGNATMRVTMIRGLDEDSVDAVYSAASVAGAASAAVCGIGVDSTTAFSGNTGYNQDAANPSAQLGIYGGLPGLGYHYVSALEINSSTTASTWYGDNNLAYFQTGLTVTLMA